MFPVLAVTTTRRALPVFIRSAPTKAFALSLSRNVRFSSNMSATPVYTKNAAPPAGPYSQAIKTPTAIYCSGQIPCDPEGNLIEGTIQEKTRQCINNLKAVLEEAGSSLEKVVKVNVFLADMGDFAVSAPCFKTQLVHESFAK